jgi:hypothetical protein
MLGRWEREAAPPSPPKHQTPNTPLCTSHWLWDASESTPAVEQMSEGCCWRTSQISKLAPPQASRITRTTEEQVHPLLHHHDLFSYGIVFLCSPSLFFTMVLPEIFLGYLEWLLPWTRIISMLRGILASGSFQGYVCGWEVLEDTQTTSFSEGGTSGQGQLLTFCGLKLSRGYLEWDCVLLLSIAIFHHGAGRNISGYLEWLFALD